MTTIQLFKRLLENRERCKELGMTPEQYKIFRYRVKQENKLSEEKMSEWLIKDGWIKTVTWKRKN